MYVKLFCSIYQGTLRGNSHGLLVFTNLLAHADKAGVVDVHPRAIAEEVGLPVDDVRSTLVMLESPDDESRSPEEQGRRIVRTDAHRAWGWRIVNYEKYRSIRSEEDRREQNRLAQERWRNKNKPTSAESKRGKPRSAQAEAEEEEEAKKDISKASPSHPPAEAGRDSAPTSPCPYSRIVEIYHEALPTLPSVKLMPVKRQKAMRTLWAWVLTSKKTGGERRATNSDEALEWIGGYFSHAAKNDFLMGRTQRSAEHAGWTCDLDFLLTDKGMKQVIEKTVEPG